MYNILAGQISDLKRCNIDVTSQELEEFGLEQGDIVVNRVNYIMSLSAKQALYLQVLERQHLKAKIYGYA